MSKYINPFTDFGFKYIFGQEQAKPFLIDFLNELLKNEPGFEPIEDVTFLDKEKTKLSKLERGVIYDILCRSIDGREFIVEMQNEHQAYYIDRGIFYISRTLSYQGEVGNDWKFSLRPVYNISFMNFTLPELEGKVRTDAALCEIGTGKQISDKIRFIFIQFPEFTVEKEECLTIFDQWLYILKHMNTMNTFPFTSDRKIYKQLEDRARYANLSVDERRAYDSQMKAYRDYHNTLQYKYDEGRAEGRAEGHVEEKIETALRLNAMGMNDEFIAAALKISQEELAEILKSSN